MIKLRNLLLLLFIVILSSINIFSQAGYSITDKLYEESDLILQGKIKRIECYLNEAGVSECEYTFSIDSVYKGIPRIYKISILEFINPNDSVEITPFDFDKTVDVTYFHRACFYYLNVRKDKIPKIPDNCFAVGDNLIVFLKDNSRKKASLGIPTDTIFPYDVTDQWSSIHYPSSYLALHLRMLSNTR